MRFSVENRPTKEGLLEYVWRTFNRLKSVIDGISFRVDGDLWDDETAAIANGTPTPSPALLANFGPGGVQVQEYVFNQGDSMYIRFPIKHQIKPGSKVYIYIRWSTDGSGAGNVAWKFTWLEAKGHGQEAFAQAATSPLIVVGAAHATPWWHHVTEASDVQAMDAPEVDSVLLMEVERGAAGDGDTYTNAGNGHVFGLYVSLHYIKDRLGTTQKAPDFYAGGQKV